MKKTFRSILAGALALLAVSCYDDSALKSAISSLDSRVTELENKINSDVNTINSKIDGLEAAYKLADKTLTDQLTALNTELTTALNTLTQRLDALDGSLDGYVAVADYTADKTALTEAITELLAADQSLTDAFTTALAALKEADSSLQQKDAEILAALVGVGVTNVSKNAAGNVVITFVDKSTLEIPTKPQEGLVTVVEEDGVKYWAVIKDGATESLGVPVGHLELKFKIDYSDNRLLYSVDNGKTWNATGAYVSSEYYFFSDFYQGREYNYETGSIEDHDYYTLVFGGDEYYLPLYKTDDSVVALKSGKTYFTYGESKEFDLQLKAISACYVMSKPDAWKAKVDGKVLTVTAPSEALVNLGVADIEGEVLLHATTNEGKCKIVKLVVSTNSGLTVSIDAQGMITLVNPFAYPVESNDDYDDELGGLPMPMPMPMPMSEEQDEDEEYVATHEFARVVLGIAPVDEFSADPAAYAKGCINGDNEDALCAYNFSQFRNQFYIKGEDGKNTDDLKYPPVPYREGVYEVDVCTFDIADFYYYFEYSKLAKGEHYVVWAVPCDEKDTPIYDDLAYVYYEPVSTEVKLVKASFSDIEVSLNLSGAEKFLVGHIAESYFSGYGVTFEEYMNMMGEGPFAMFQMMSTYNKQQAEYYLGASFENGTEGEYLVSALNAYGEADVLAPGSKYYVWAMPVVAGLSYADYDFETNFMPYVQVFETTPLEYSATAAASVEIDYTVTPKTVSATVEVEDAVMAYYLFFVNGIYTDYSDYSNRKQYDINEMTSQEIADLLISCGTPRNEFPFNVYESDLDPESTNALVVLAIDENGCYGDPIVETIETAPVTYAQDFSAEFKSFDAETGVATFDVTGDAQKVVCYRAYEETYTTNFINWMLDCSYEYYNFKYSNVVDGVTSVSGLTGSSEWLIYVAYSEDASGNSTFTEPKVVKIVE